MIRRLTAIVALACCGAYAQDWMTVGADAQRSSWIRADRKISVEHLRTPGFGLAWKVKTAHDPSPAATLGFYIGYRGFRSLAFLGSSGGDLTAIDTDLGRIEWKKSVPATGRASAGCPAGMTAEVTRPTMTDFPTGQPVRGGGRSAPAKSRVGEPNEGAVTIAEVAARAAADVGRRPPPRTNVPSPFAPIPQYVFALSSDGMLHRMYVSNGEEPDAPVQFMDRSANAHGLIVVNNIAYVATYHGCGGVPNGIWALDLATKKTVHWTATGDIAGEDGPAFGPDGTVYAATKDGQLVALDPKTLAVKASYNSGGQAFITSPLVFEYKMKTMLVAGTADNRLHVVDAQSLTGAAYDAKVSGPLVSWQDTVGTRWVAAPSKDSLTAWKVVDQDGSPVLQPGWTSRQMASPLTPMAVNGVLFAVSNSAAPVLYAFEGVTGKELWNSGKTLTARVHNSRLSFSDSQVYLGTSDGTIYSFGFPIEH